jgi:predicted O-methyltransferase YrrM
MIKIMRSGIEQQGFEDYLEYLNNLQIQFKTILEIGSYIGESTILFKNKFPDAFLYIVDPWINNYDISDPTINIMSMEKVEHIFNELMYNKTKYCKFKMTSDEFFQVQNIPEFFDLIYIDGNHSYEYVKRDLQNSLNVIKKDGIISGHDYGRDINHTLGVTKAINEIIGEPDVIFKDSSWIKYVRNFKRSKK